MNIGDLVTNSTFVYIDNEAFGYDSGIALISLDGVVTYGLYNDNSELDYADVIYYANEYLNNNSLSIENYVGVYYFYDYECYFIPVYDNADYYLFNTGYYGDSIRVSLGYDTTPVAPMANNLDFDEVYYNVYLTQERYTLVINENNGVYAYCERENFVYDNYEQANYNGFDRNVFEFEWLNGGNIRIGWYKQDSNAYDSGYYDGYNVGYNTGYNNGYQYGYNQGSISDEQANAFTYIGNAITAVGQILEIEILPHISLGLVASIPIVFGILMAFIRMVKK